MMQDNERTNNLKSIRSKLCWDDLIKVKNPNNERVDREAMSHSKQLLIYGKMSRRHHSLNRQDQGLELRHPAESNSNSVDQQFQTQS